MLVDFSKPPALKKQKKRGLNPWGISIFFRGDLLEGLADSNQTEGNI